MDKMIKTEILFIIILFSYKIRKDLFFGIFTLFVRENEKERDYYILSSPFNCFWKHGQLVFFVKRVLVKLGRIMLEMVHKLICLSKD